jgi:hypothetical protein
MLNNFETKENYFEAIKYRTALQAAYSLYAGLGIGSSWIPHIFLGSKPRISIAFRFCECNFKK